jgi:hypothetical protein
MRTNQQEKYNSAAVNTPSYNFSSQNKRIGNHAHVRGSLSLSLSLSEKIIIQGELIILLKLWRSSCFFGTTVTITTISMMKLREDSTEEMVFTIHFRILYLS